MNATVNLTVAGHLVSSRNDGKWMSERTYSPASFEVGECNAAPAQNASVNCHNCPTVSAPPCSHVALINRHCWPPEITARIFDAAIAFAGMGLVGRL